MTAGTGMTTTTTTTTNDGEEKEFFLTIVRHGQTTANVLKNIQGHLDTPLTELGIEQASTLGKYFLDNGPRRFHRIYTSDLGRAQETCRIILSHLSGPDEVKRVFESTVVSDSRLRERKYGEAYEGKPIDSLKSEAFALGFNEEDFTKYTPVGAESMNQVKMRVADFCRDTLLQECQHDEEVLLISHWATIKEILKLFQPKANDSIRREHLLETPNTAFSRFKIRCKSLPSHAPREHQRQNQNHHHPHHRPLPPPPPPLPHHHHHHQQQHHNHNHNQQQQQPQLPQLPTGIVDKLDQPGAREPTRNDPDSLVCIKTISLHQIPHLRSNQTSVNMRQQVE